MCTGQGTGGELQILHSACGFVQDDAGTPLFMMTRGGCVYGDKGAVLFRMTGNVILSTSRCHSSAKNLEKKGGTTDREHCTFVSC